MKYPISFENKVIGAFGMEGRAWLKSLESIVQIYLKRWKLASVGPVNNLSSK